MKDLRWRNLMFSHDENSSSTDIHCWESALRWSFSLFLLKTRIQTHESTPWKQVLMPSDTLLERLVVVPSQLPAVWVALPWCTLCVCGHRRRMLMLLWEKTVFNYCCMASHTFSFLNSLFLWMCSWWERVKLLSGTRTLRPFLICLLGEASLLFGVHDGPMRVSGFCEVPKTVGWGQ